MPIDIKRFATALANDPFKGSVHNCFSYAWAAVKRAGGKDVDSSPADVGGRGLGLDHLATLIKMGKLAPGDVIYANYRPGTDPNSVDLSNGPHWFVYKGNGKFQDQYGSKTLAEMQSFIPDRKIDTIYHPFGLPQTTPRVQGDSYHPHKKSA